jgi:hypothetical protein
LVSFTTSRSSRCLCAAGTDDRLRQSRSASNTGTLIKCIPEVSLPRDAAFLLDVFERSERESYWSLRSFGHLSGVHLCSTMLPSLVCPSQRTDCSSAPLQRRRYGGRFLSTEAVHIYVDL